MLLFEPASRITIPRPLTMATVASGNLAAQRPVGPSILLGHRYTGAMKIYDARPPVAGLPLRVECCHLSRRSERAGSAISRHSDDSHKQTFAYRPEPTRLSPSMPFSRQFDSEPRVAAGRPTPIRWTYTRRLVAPTGWDSRHHDNHRLYECIMDC